MRALEQPDKFKAIKKVTVLGQEICEDLLKKMNFAETRKFCLTIESELRKFVTSPLQYIMLLLIQKIGLHIKH